MIKVQQNLLPANGQNSDAVMLSNSRHNHSATMEEEKILIKTNGDDDDQQTADEEEEEEDVELDEAGQEKEKEDDRNSCDVYDDDDDGHSKDSSRTMDTGIHSRSEEIIYHSDSHTNNMGDVDCQKKCDISSLLANREADFKIEEKIEEITTTKYDSDGDGDEHHNGKTSSYDLEQYDYELNFNCGGKALFPELGMEIVDMHEQIIADDDGDKEEDADEDDDVDRILDYDDDDNGNKHRSSKNVSVNVKREFKPSIGVKLIDCACWEENWLFQKKKKAENDYVQQYCLMNLDLALNPVCMTIPNPSQMISPSIGSTPIDELSDLSEHNSAESIPYSSSDDDDDELEEKGKQEKVFSETKEEEIKDCLDKSATKLSLNSSVQKFNASKQINCKPIPVTLTVPQFVPKHLRKHDQVTLSVKSDQNSCHSQNSSNLPHFSMIPQSASVQSGILVQFCCRVRGDKPLGVSWYFAGKLIQNDANYRIFKHFTDHIFEIQNTNRELSGQYTCCVYNNSGVQWTDFSVNINDRINMGVEKDPFKVIQLYI